MKTLLALTSLILLLVACGGESVGAGCSTADAETAATLSIDGAAWDFYEVEQVAERTSRMSLAPLLREMQTTRDSLRDEDWPECASAVKAAYLAWTTATIDAYLAFMDEDRIVMERLLHDALTAWQTATEALLALSPEAE